jgi:hypothetical protein
VTEPVEGLPGNVYKLSVHLADYATLVNNNPDLKNFRFPPEVGVKLLMGPVNPLNPDNSILISQGGIVMYLK